MKFTCSVDIDLPAEKAGELFGNRENLKHWQPGFVSLEHVSGTAGQAGAKSRMRFKNGKHEFDLMETITVSELPREFSGHYETEGICWNSMKNSFTPIGENRTRYAAEIEYKFIGTMVKIMAFLMPWMFKKQVQKSLDQFKTFAESRATAT